MGDGLPLDITMIFVDSELFPSFADKQAPIPNQLDPTIR